MNSPEKPSDQRHDDIRMRGFASRTPVADVLRWIDRHALSTGEEAVPLSLACGRILAADITSDLNVPTFRRSMMDGYALHASDTAGATSYNPLTLAIIGEALPGRSFTGDVEPGQAVRVMTGAPMPAGADAVLQAEKTSETGDELTVLGETTPEKHVGRIGEDIKENSVVLSQGRVLRPQDIGVLASIGKSVVPVVRQPIVRLIITGNELLPHTAEPKEGHIFDSNGPMLAALVARDGGVVNTDGIVADEPAAIRAALLSPCDIALVSGGSSVGKEDFAPQLVAELGELAIHGVAMRPSSPTGIGRIANRLVMLLPGNPVSCLCAYDFFAGRAIRQMGGMSTRFPYGFDSRKLTRKLVSTVGRVDYARVRITDDGVEPIAISGASILSSTTRADGFVIVPQDSEGFPAGAEVMVWLYDS